MTEEKKTELIEIYKNLSQISSNAEKTEILIVGLFDKLERHRREFSDELANLSIAIGSK